MQQEAGRRVDQVFPLVNVNFNAPRRYNCLLASNPGGSTGRGELFAFEAKILGCVHAMDGGSLPGAEASCGANSDTYHYPRSESLAGIFWPAGYDFGNRRPTRRERSHSNRVGATAG